MNKIIIGSFYTKDTPYKEVANTYLIPSCEALDLQWRLVEVSPNYHNWSRNVAEKPSVILDMLNIRLYPEECLVFLDADSKILCYPELFTLIPEEYDIAFHYLDWRTWYKYENSNVKELLTGTMFFRNNNKVKELCKEWYEESIKTSEWEQKVLQRIISKHKLNIYELPLQYCYINSLPNGKEPYVKCDDIVIKHYQLSRKFKKGGLK